MTDLETFITMIKKSKEIYVIESWGNGWVVSLEKGRIKFYFDKDENFMKL